MLFLGEKKNFLCQELKRKSLIIVSKKTTNGIDLNVAFCNYLQDKLHFQDVAELW